MTFSPRSRLDAGDEGDDQDGDRPLRGAAVQRGRVGAVRGVSGAALWPHGGAWKSCLALKNREAYGPKGWMSSLCLL